MTRFYYYKIVSFYTGSIFLHYVRGMQLVSTYKNINYADNFSIDLIYCNSCMRYANDRNYHVHCLFLFVLFQTIVGTHNVSFL